MQTVGKASEGCCLPSAKQHSDWVSIKQIDGAPGLGAAPEQPQGPGRPREPRQHGPRPALLSSRPPLVPPRACQPAHAPALLHLSHNQYMNTRSLRVYCGLRVSRLRAGTRDYRTARRCTMDRGCPSTLTGSPSGGVCSSRSAMARRLTAPARASSRAASSAAQPLARRRQLRGPCVL